MLTLAELHGQLDEALNINTVDTVFDKRYYTDLINGVRSLFLKNEYSKRYRTIDPDIVQQLSCVDVSLVSPIDCCGISLPGCELLRTDVQIPEFIEFNKGKGLLSVSPTDITKIPYSIIDFSQVPYIGTGRVNHSLIYAFIHNSYIYLLSKDFKFSVIKKINIRGVFEDPTEVVNFSDCDGKPCWTENDDYPIKTWMWEYMKVSIIEQLIKKQQIPLDYSNNAKDDKTNNQPSE